MKPSRSAETESDDLGANWHLEFRTSAEGPECFGRISIKNGAGQMRRKQFCTNSLAPEQRQSLNSVVEFYMIVWRPIAGLTFTTLVFII